MTLRSFYARAPVPAFFPADLNIIKNLFPRVWHLSNFVAVFQKVDFSRYYLNSILVALAVTLGQLVNLFAGGLCVFSRMKFTGRDGVLFSLSWDADGSGHSDS